MRYAATSSAENVHLALSNQTSVHVVKQNDVNQKPNMQKRQWENCLLKLKMLLLD